MSDPAAPPRPPLAWAAVLPFSLGLSVAVLVVAATSAYGLHRDEYLYLALGRHLRLWSMDWPPGIALLAELGRLLFGTSKVAVRVLPALAGGAVVVLAAVAAREFGGDRRAQALAALAVVCVPLFPGAASMFQTVVFDQLWWTLALVALARALRTARLSDWLLLGVAAGLGLLTKFTFGVAGLAIAVGLVLTPARRVFATRGPYVALATALVVASPAFVGQIRLGFPVLLQMEALRAAQLERVTPAAFLSGQFFYGPGVWVAAVGAAALVSMASLRAYRAVGVACVVAFALVLSMKGKAYYIGPIYPVLIAAGAVVIARVDGRPGRVLRGVLAAALVAFMAVSLPFTMPVLPPAAMARYAARVGPSSNVTTNTGTVLALPQDYADMLGWQRQAEAVARVYRSLPPSDRADVVLLAGNYGEAGALDYHGPRLGLPPARHPEGSYWYFGPGERPGRVVIAIGVPPDELVQLFGDVRVATRVDEPWGVPEERDVPVVVARQPRQPLQQIWPSFEGRY